MCTVTWIREESGYHVFCNRDEKLTRRPSALPRQETRGGVRFVAPVDGDFGGTWIATNEFGVTLCLLNGANLSGIEASPRTGKRRSRGLLIPELIGARSVVDRVQDLRNRDLAQFASFTLAILERGMDPVIVEWNGRHTLIEHDGNRHLPLVSSSVDGEGARTKRRYEYRRVAGAAGPPDLDSLLEFHRSHAFGPGPFSTCMHRHDAETVSFTQVRVTESSVMMFHSPSAPCRRAPAVSAAFNLRS
jgi:hypothetical protein